MRIIVQCRMLPAFIIVCVFRQPYAPVNTFDYILEKIRMICSIKKDIYNLDYLNDDLFSIYNKRQLIHRTTRITRNSATLLDHKITKNPEIVTRFDEGPITKADHDIVCVTINRCKPKLPPQI